MKLLNIFQTVFPDLKSTDKKAVIKEMLEGLVKAGKMEADSQDKVMKVLMDREELGSTGIGRGVAVPHAKHNVLKELIGVVGRSSHGIPFDSLDGEPVNVFFMLLSSRKASDQLLVALAKVAALVKDDNFISFIRNAKNEAEIKDTLRDADETLFSG